MPGFFCQAFHKQIQIRTQASANHTGIVARRDFKTFLAVQARTTPIERI
jgi:hypothetical protein